MMWPLPSAPRSWDEDDYYFISLDGIAAALSAVVVSLLQRSWPDPERRQLELENMRLQNAKIQAEIEVLKHVELVEAAAASTVELEQDPEPPPPPKGRRRRG